LKFVLTTLLSNLVAIRASKFVVGSVWASFITASWANEHFHSIQLWVALLALAMRLRANQRIKLTRWAFHILTPKLDASGCFLRGCNVPQSQLPSSPIEKHVHHCLTLHHTRQRGFTAACNLLMVFIVAIYTRSVMLIKTFPALREKIVFPFW